MSNKIPNTIKIYHIVHISNLPSIVEDGYLFSDAEMMKRTQSGVKIGMEKIKDRRRRLPISSHPGLKVGECVPFYFCPRSPMLYMFDRQNSPEIEYRDGQEPIVHLVADFRKTAIWAKNNNLRWAFTDSNAGSNFFEDYNDFADLDKINWDVVNATHWSGQRDKKQAEFLVENHFPLELVEEIGVYSSYFRDQVSEIISPYTKEMNVKIQKAWYY